MLSQLSPQHLAKLCKGQWYQDKIPSARFTAAQIDLGGPSYTDQDGIQMMTLPYIATPTSAGNNEFSLVYT